MKKRSSMLLLIVGIIFIGLVVGIVKGKEKEDYKIISTIKNSFDNYESVSIKVIINKRKYDVERIMYDVCNFYWELHKDTDEIHISLFRSQKDYDMGKVCASERFFKEY